MKYIDLFAGIGGFRLGIGDRGECVYTNEWDKYAAQIYEKNFGHKDCWEYRERTRSPKCLRSNGDCPYGEGKSWENYKSIVDTRDITTVSTDDIPDHDLLVGGFPCQAFSIAGKRGGFNDTRGTLFFDIARILKAKQPRLCLLENVKGLLSHDNGRTFKTIIATLNELGYDCQWQVLNSKNFGVPQNRERVFIIGHLRGTSRPKVFPIREDSKQDIVLPTPTARYYGGQANGGYIGHKPKQIIGGSQGNRVYDPSGISTTIASQAGGLGAKTGLYLKDMKIRRLTPVECERLQGFPDNWTEGISDTQRYKCLGNAVTVNVVQAIVENLNN